MTTDSALLRLEGIDSGYGRSAVIHGVNLAVDRGETVCLIGPNGAGKSTLIKTIAGVIRPTCGRIIFDGVDITAAPIHERVERGIALAPEGRGVLPGLSVEENLFLGGYVRRRGGQVRKDMQRFMELFPVLAQRRAQAAGTLSGGEQQMLVIARALMSSPKLLILDEPSFGLAPLVVASIFRKIHELGSQGMTILLVEQNANMALDAARRGYVMETGRCVLDGPTAELRKSRIVRDVYLGVGHEPSV